MTPGERRPRKTHFPREVGAAQRQTVFHNREPDGARVNESNVIGCQGVKTDNGIVWIIGSVLPPMSRPEMDELDRDSCATGVGIEYDSNP